MIKQVAAFFCENNPAPDSKRSGTATPKIFACLVDVLISEKPLETLSDKYPQPRQHFRDNGKESSAGDPASARSAH